MKKFVSKSKYTTPFRAKKWTGRLGRFASSDDGSMTILVFFLFMTVLYVAGFAVDMMRYDRERVRLQYALDRAVLAAADLDQELCPRDVVRDYLSKENLEQFLVGEIVVEPDTCGAQNARLAGKRLVAAQADMQIETHFMKWSGVDTLPYAATSVAEEAIGNVEISLVLDVSGSMGGNRIFNLKQAANNFIDEMTAKSEEGKLSISIIPYSEQVSVPDFLMDELNTIGANEVANCIDFQSADFSTMEFDAYDIVDPDTGVIIRKGSYVPQTLHFRDNGSRDFRPNNGLVSSNICRRETTTDKREMAIMQKDADALKAKINALQASGWTSIDVGLKWGLTLLDDSIQPLIAQLSNQGNIPTEFAIRPGRNRTSDTLKVLVLMTDGANTRQHMVNSPYNDGLSDIYWNHVQDQYSVYDEENVRYAWPDVPMTRQLNDGSRWTRDYYQNHAHGAGSFLRYRCTEYWDGRCHNTDRSRSIEENEGNVAPVELLWPDVWAHTEKNKIYNLLRHTFGTDYANDWWDDSSTELRQWNKDPRVRTLCAQAEQEDVLIFSIAFEAPESVKPLLRDCAVDAGRYYEASGSQIVGVFDSISATIQNLRLTQ